MSQPNSDETKTSPSPIASRTRGIVREMESKTTSCCCLLCGYYVKDIHMLMPHVLQHPASARRRKVEHQLTKALEAANREAMNSSIPSAEVLVATDPTPPLHQTPEEIHSPISSPNSGNEASQSEARTPRVSPKHPFAPAKHWVEDFSPTRHVTEALTQIVDLVAYDADPPSIPSLLPVSDHIVSQLEHSPIKEIGTQSGTLLINERDTSAQNGPTTSG
ncbi:hypothetical protein TNCT_476421 [Trichonephila clavata]|uniref:Uncharacterized protein n=1 Tax=Trichonephila clavata TaxID=2740835 RepID=A0A8X6G157_TRICU|nr:hypothetical protein TNCT_476421 [Trichonephila clavata]